jgi:hypothetical protein
MPEPSSLPQQSGEVRELIACGRQLVRLMNEGADTNPVTRRQAFFDFQSALAYAEEATASDHPTSCATCRGTGQVRHEIWFAQEVDRVEMRPCPDGCAVATTGNQKP